MLEDDHTPVSFVESTYGTTTPSWQCSESPLPEPPLSARLRSPLFANQRANAPEGEKTSKEIEIFPAPLSKKAADCSHKGIKSFGFGWQKDAPNMEDSQSHLASRLTSEHKQQSVLNLNKTMKAVDVTVVHGSSKASEKDAIEVPVTVVKPGMALHLLHNTQHVLPCIVESIESTTVAAGGKMVICPSRLKCSPRSACIATPPLGCGRSLVDAQYTVIGSTGSSTTAASPNMSVLGSQGSSVSISSNLSTASWATSTQATHDLNSQLGTPVISREIPHFSCREAYIDKIIDS